MYVYTHTHTLYGGFHKWRYPKMDGLQMCVMEITLLRVIPTMTCQDA